MIARLKKCLDMEKDEMNMISGRKFERKKQRYGQGFSTLRSNLKNFMTCLFSLCYNEKSKDSMQVKILKSILSELFERNLVGDFLSLCVSSIRSEFSNQHEM